MARVTKQEARRLADKMGIDFTKDYHQLRNREVDNLGDIRKLTGYRKPVSASGSTTRYFFYYLQKVRG